MKTFRCPAGRADPMLADLLDPPVTVVAQDVTGIGTLDTAHVARIDDWRLSVVRRHARRKEADHRETPDARVRGHLTSCAQHGEPVTTPSMSGYKDCGKSRGLLRQGAGQIFVRGKVIAAVPENQIVERLLEEALRLTEQLAPCPGKEQAP